MSHITSISLTRTDLTGTNQGYASGYDFLGFQGGFTRTKGTAETIHFTTDRRDTRVTCKAALTPHHLSIVLKQKCFQYELRIFVQKSLVIRMKRIDKYNV